MAVVNIETRCGTTQHGSLLQRETCCAATRYATTANMHTPQNYAWGVHKLKMTATQAFIFSENSRSEAYFRRWAPKTVGGQYISCITIHLQQTPVNANPIAAQRYSFARNLLESACSEDVS